MVRRFDCGECGRPCKQKIKRGQLQRYCCKLCRDRHFRHTDLERRERDRAAYARIKERVYVVLGACCQCCGEERRVFLTVDHIYNDGNRWNRTGTRLSKILKDPQRYQILCMNCNWAKRYGPCPHTTDAPDAARKEPT